MMGKQFISSSFFAGLFFLGWMWSANAQLNKAFQAVALHVSPGNLAIMEYEGTPISKGTAIIELPLGLTPERVFWSYLPSKASITGTETQQGPNPSLIIQTLRDSVRRQRAVSDFASLISLNIGRQVAVETFDGSENIGYNGVIAGIDQKGEVLVLTAGQDSHNIPVRQIMYWSAGADWKNALESMEPSGYRIQLVVPGVWDAGTIQVWVETRQVDCAYSYRLKTSGKARLALDVSLRAPFAFNECSLVGHPSLHAYSSGASHAPLFRLTASGGTGTGVWTATAREDEVSLLIKEDWNFSAVSVTDSQFRQLPSTRATLLVKPLSNSVGLMKIPLLMESDHQPPTPVKLLDALPNGKELHIELGESVLTGADIGKIRRGRFMTEGNKAVGPEGWWVDGQIESDYSGTIPVEWTVHRSFLPDYPDQTKQKFILMERKDMTPEALALQRTIQITTDNRYALSYSYFLIPIQKGKK
ncbi:MAG: hypothetical protein EBS53_03385 [Bacteroidetes bacterium]|nr:hypothetical protein [Bacteroidota bacterium]